MTYDTTCSTMAEGPEQNRRYHCTLQDHSYHLEWDDTQLEIVRVHHPRSRPIDALEILSSYPACRKDVLKKKQDERCPALKKLLFQVHQLIVDMKAGEEGTFSRSYVLNILRFCSDIEGMADHEMSRSIHNILQHLNYLRPPGDGRLPGVLHPFGQGRRLSPGHLKTEQQSENEL